VTIVLLLIWSRKIDLIHPLHWPNHGFYQTVKKQAQEQLDAFSTLVSFGESHVKNLASLQKENQSA
jgi:hypothetical protein